jgi:hypothetical protein
MRHVISIFGPKKINPRLGQRKNWTQRLGVGLELKIERPASRLENEMLTF